MKKRKRVRIAANILWDFKESQIASTYREEAIEELAQIFTEFKLLRLRAQLWDLRKHPLIRTNIKFTSTPTSLKKSDKLVKSIDQWMHKYYAISVDAYINPFE